VPATHEILLKNGRVNETAVLENAAAKVGL